MPQVSRVIAFAICVLLGACNASAGVPGPVPSLPPSATPSTDELPIAPTVPAPTIPVESYYIQPGVPASIAQQVIDTMAPLGLAQAETPETATVQVMLNPGADAVLRADWFYTVVVPFNTIRDSYSWSELLTFWTGTSQPTDLPYEPVAQFTMTEDVRALLVGQLGGGVGTINIATDTAGIADLLWAQRQYGIVPFDALEPRVKVLSLDGQNVLDKAMDTSSYPLVAHIGVSATSPAGNQALGVLQQAGWRATNRDTSKMTTVVLTGVTALSRAVAKSMEVYGVDFPSAQILPFLADADILHISNEASFDPTCPPPDWYGDPVFCEHRANYELLRNVGMDIVELTGNHNLDYGVGPAINSLDVYDNEGIPYFGGGRNTADAQAARILNAPDGTRIAFVGCNSIGPVGAWATDATPGAADCGDWGWIKQAIADLKANDQADVVIASIQYRELDSYAPSDEQRADFEALSAAGADIVSGSQAHQPQGFTFVNGKLVHFGVGNLFFDQVDYDENRQMFADKHILYEGRHISTILFTGWFDTVAQPRPMTPEERTNLLQLVFEASGW